MYLPTGSLSCDGAGKDEMVVPERQRIGLPRLLAGPHQVHAAGDRLVRLAVGDMESQESLSGRPGNARGQDRLATSDAEGDRRAWRPDRVTLFPSRSDSD